jgi:hypothetical protein
MMKRVILQVTNLFRIIANKSYPKVTFWHAGTACRLERLEPFGIGSHRAGITGINIVLLNRSWRIQHHFPFFPMFTHTLCEDFVAQKIFFDKIWKTSILSSDPRIFCAG